jgi:hypothetical protein
LSHQIVFVFDRRGADDELVLGRPARELAGRDEESATLAQAPFTAAQRGFDQGGFEKVVVNGTKARDPELVEGLCPG